MRILEYGLMALGVVFTLLIVSGKLDWLLFRGDDS